MAVMAWGENIQIFMELGFPVNPFTLDDAVLGVLDEDYLDGTLIGDDVSAYAQEISISRGRSDQLQNFNAGTFSVRLLNRDRRFDPINTSSPYWNSTLGVSGVAPRRKVSVFSDGVALFTGRITDIDVSYEPNNPNATSENSYVTITASDDFVLLANTFTENALTPTQELSGTRVTTILDLPEVNYPATRNIDAGSATLGGGATFDIGANTNVLTYLQEVATSEQGYFFVAANGDLTFTDRIAASFTTPSAYFSDTGSNIPYTSLSVMYGQEFLYNKVVCAVEGGTDQTVNDVSSQTEYGISTLNLSGLLLVDDAAALTLANDLLDRYKLPEYRFDKLQTIYNPLDSVKQADLTGLDVADVVSITRSYPTGTPSSVTKEYSIENIRHVITPSSHTVEFGLSVADLVYPFVLAGYPIATTRTNLVANPNFEVDLSTWTTVGTVVRTTAQFYSGVASASLTYAGSGTVLIQQSTRSTVTAGLTYTASFYLKQSVDAGDVICNFIWYNAGGSIILDDTHQTNNPNTGWQRFSQTRTAPANAASCSFRIYQTAGEGGGAVATVDYVDAVLIEQTSTVLPYFDGTYVADYTGYGLSNKAWNGTANASTSTASWFVGNTRTNLCINPSFESSPTGIWGGYQATISRVAGSLGYGSWVGQAVATVAGVGGFFNSFSATAGVTYTASLTGLRISGSRTYRLQFEFYNGGTYLGGASTMSQSFATATRVSWTYTAPAGTTVAYIVCYSVGSGSIGDTFQIDNVLIEASSTLLPYFDGTYADTYTGYTLTAQQWNGTADASTSTAVWGLDSSYVGTPMDSDYALT